MNAKGGTITYDEQDWLAGQDTTSAGNNGRKIGNGLAFSEKIDPLRNLGYISPSNNTLSVTNNSSVTSLVRGGVMKGQEAYLIAGTNPGSGQSGGIVHKLESLVAGTINITAPFPHTISHGAHTSIAGYDIVNYTANVGGTPTLLNFFSFSDNTDWDVGIYNYGANTFDDDFMSTVPATPLTGATLTGGLLNPHPLIVGDDDILYMGDRNFVHAYDGATGTNGTFYEKVLTLPQGWIITCFAKSNDQKLLIGAYYSPSNYQDSFYLGSAKVYKWNYLDLDFDYAYNLNDNYVSELLNWGEGIIAFTEGRKTQTETGTKKLQALTSNGFKVLQTYSSGVLPVRGGVDVIGTDIYWNGGLIYFYAKNPFGDNYIFGSINGSSSGLAGMCKTFTNIGNIHWSNGTQAAGFGVQYALSDYGESAIGYGKVATPIFPERKRGRLKKVDLYFKETMVGGAGGGRSFRLNTVLDKSDSATTTDFNTISNLKMEIVDFKNDGTPLGDFSTLQPLFIWANNISGDNKANAPILEKCVYFFEYTDINQGLQT